MWAIVIAGAGLARLVLSAARRLVAGRVSLGVELDLRNRLYGHLQSLELSFLPPRPVIRSFIGSCISSSRL